MSEAPVWVRPYPPDPNPERQQHTFVELLKGRETEYPLLTQAVENAEPATSFKIYWGGEDGEAHENWTQIVRFPYDGQPVEQGSWNLGADHHEPTAALQEFLSAIERILWDGKPGYSARGLYPKGACGGVWYYLGRDLIPEDTVKLRILREPTLRTQTHVLISDATGERTWMDRDDPAHWMELPSPVYEWLAEFSLEVTAG